MGCGKTRADEKLRPLPGQFDLLRLRPPNGFEFCVNHVAIDANGVAYANREDGNLYAIAQGGALAHGLFLNLSLGAAYTSVSIGPDGKIYTQNFGHLIVAGAGP